MAASVPDLGRTHVQSRDVGPELAARTLVPAPAHVERLVGRQHERQAGRWHPDVRAGITGDVVHHEAGDVRNQDRRHRAHAADGSPEPGHESRRPPGGRRPRGHTPSQCCGECSGSTGAEPLPCLLIANGLRLPLPPTRVPAVPEKDRAPRLSSPTQRAAHEARPSQFRPCTPSPVWKRGSKVITSSISSRRSAGQRSGASSRWWLGEPVCRLGHGCAFARLEEARLRSPPLEPVEQLAIDVLSHRSGGEREVVDAVRDPDLRHPAALSALSALSAPPSPR